MDVHELALVPAIARACWILRETDDETLADQVAIARIPAPPFGEAARARWVRARFAALGLLDAAADDAGNVLARLPAAASATGEIRRPVLLAAHLDTVFPEGTAVEVRREGGRLVAPGITDNARGLAALLGLARALVRAEVYTLRPLVFVATVGEEGIGDLRGVKHLFREGSPWRAAEGFITLDGSGRRRIVQSALGSRRLRATVTGPGGHSWADWGRGNPVHALGLAVADFVRYAPPRRPRTTLTVGRMAGGTSINAIPSEAWVEIDLRSESPRALAALEARVRQALERAVHGSNGRRRRGTPSLDLRIDVIGDRPSGETPADSAIVAAARAATRFTGETPELVASSTDANIAIALGIPAIGMGAGGRSGGTHTLDEWYENDGGPAGIERALLTVLAVAEVASP